MWIVFSDRRCRWSYRDLGSQALLNCKTTLPSEWIIHGSQRGCFEPGFFLNFERRKVTSGKRRRAWLFESMESSERKMSQRIWAGFRRERRSFEPQIYLRWYENCIRMPRYATSCFWIEERFSNQRDTHFARGIHLITASAKLVFHNLRL